MALTAESALRKDRTTSARLEHRHFAEIARIIAGMTDLANGNTDLAKLWQGRVARHFASELARTNPRFDRARFLRACGVEE